MCNSMVDNGCDVILLLPKFNYDSKPVKLLELNLGYKIKFEIKLYKQDFKFQFFNKYSISKDLINTINKQKPQYIFTRIPKYIKPILARKYNLIFESHNNILHNRYRLLDKYWKRIIRKNINNQYFKVFISISTNLFNYWNNFGIPKSKQIILHDGVSKDFVLNFKDKLSSRKKLKIRSDQRIVMYVGSLYKDREIENIIYAAKKTPKLNYYIVGGPSDNLEYYKGIANKMSVNNIEFTGHISHSEIPTYLSSADVLLALWSKKVPTINFCSPLKVFEYMASGKIIIAHNFPTINEVLKNLNSVYLVDTVSNLDLISRLKKIELQEKLVFSDQAKELVLDKYTWDKRVKKIINYLNEK